MAGRNPRVHRPACLGRPSLATIAPSAAQCRLPGRRPMRDLAAAATIGLALAAFLAPSAGLAASPPLPKSPVTLNVIDVGGVLALTQKGIERYRDSHPQLVSRI